MFCLHIADRPFQIPASSNLLVNLVQIYRPMKLMRRIQSLLLRSGKQHSRSTYHFWMLSASTAVRLDIFKSVYCDTKISCSKSSDIPSPSHHLCFSVTNTITGPIFRLFLVDDKVEPGCDRYGSADSFIPVTLVQQIICKLELERRRQRYYGSRIANSGCMDDGPRRRT